MRERMLLVVGRSLVLAAEVGKPSEQLSGKAKSPAQGWAKCLILWCRLSESNGSPDDYKLAKKTVCP
jgi:hypothetical protein